MNIEQFKRLLVVIFITSLVLIVPYLIGCTNIWVLQDDSPLMIRKYFSGLLLIMGFIMILIIVWVVYELIFNPIIKFIKNGK